MEAADADVEDARLEPATVVGRHGDAARGDVGQGRFAQRDRGGRTVAPSHQHDKHRDNNMTSVDSC